MWDRKPGEHQAVTIGYVSIVCTVKLLPVQAQHSGKNHDAAQRGRCVWLLHAFRHKIQRLKPGLHLY